MKKKMMSLVMAGVMASAIIGCGTDNNSNQEAVSYTHLCDATL